METIEIDKFILLNMAQTMTCHACPLLHECEEENRDTLYDREEHDIFPSAEFCINMWLSCGGAK